MLRLTGLAYFDTSAYASRKFFPTSIVHNLVSMACFADSIADIVSGLGLSPFPARYIRRRVASFIEVIMSVGTARIVLSLLTVASAGTSAEPFSSTPPKWLALSAPPLAGSPPTRGTSPVISISVGASRSALVGIGLRATSADPLGIFDRPFPIISCECLKARLRVNRV